MAAVSASPGASHAAVSPLPPPEEEEETKTGHVLQANSDEGGHSLESQVAHKLNGLQRDRKRAVVDLAAVDMHAILRVRRWSARVDTQVVQVSSGEQLRARRAADGRVREEAARGRARAASTPRVSFSSFHSN